MPTPIPNSETPEIDYGFIVGKFIYLGPDFNLDPTRLPYTVSAPVEIQLVPAAPLRYLEGEAETLTFIEGVLKFALDDHGNLIDKSAAPGAWVPFGVYHVSVVQTGRTITKFDIEVTGIYTAENPLDLTKRVPVTNPPAAYQMNQAVLEQALQAAADAIAARDQALAILAQIQGNGGGGNGGGGEPTDVSPALDPFMNTSFPGEGNTTQLMVEGLAFQWTQTGETDQQMELVFDWGDGTQSIANPDSGFPSGTSSVTVFHTYETTGTYVVTFTATYLTGSRSGETASVSTQVEVVA